MDKSIISEAAEALDVLTSKIPEQHPIRLHAQQRAKALVEALYLIANAPTQQELFT